MQVKARTRLAILECDTALPGIAQKYGGYGGLFKVLLNTGSRMEGYEKVDDVLDISIHHVEDDPNNYPNLEEIDALLLTGSRHDSFTNPPWILKLVNYTKDAIQTNRIRTIGICFGHQIIARALGVEVGRNPQGWEAAVCGVNLTPRGQELFQLQELKIHQSHRDMVYSYPEGVESLGSSPECAVQGMYAPQRIISLQGHPEFNGPIMQEIIDTRHKTGAFDEEAYQKYAKKVYLQHDGETVGAAFVRFLLGTEEAKNQIRISVASVEA